jgi:hypothetical protein
VAVHCDGLFLACQVFRAEKGADCKSTDFPFAINDHSEKSAKFSLFQINSLALGSE